MKQHDTLLVNKMCLLEKFPERGGWTYTCLPEIASDPTAPFGWVRVKGNIDHIEIRQYHLMPMGNGTLFLPVKSEIRRKIRKQVGEWVHIILYLDKSPVEIPQEFIDCLRDEPQAYVNFNEFTDSQKKAYIDWIYGAKRKETQIERMARAIYQIAQNLKFKER